MVCNSSSLASLRSITLLTILLLTAPPKIYLIAIRSISFFESFLSGGCVGTNLLSSAKAPLTFCCRQRSLQLVKSFRGGRRRHELRSGMSSEMLCVEIVLLMMIIVNSHGFSVIQPSLMRSHCGRRT